VLRGVGDVVPAEALDSPATGGQRPVSLRVPRSGQRIVVERLAVGFDDEALSGPVKVNLE